MKRTVAIGVQDFEGLREDRCFYVDKTNFITEWWKGKDAVTLITRPRRFGKTLNMSMMNCFFSNRYANRGDLFEGLKVWEDPDMCKEQGTWPVIFLSFAGVKLDTYQKCRKSLNLLIANLYNAYRWLLEDPRFSEADRSFFASVNGEMDDPTATISISHLCGWLEQYYGKKVLIFLDEYDTPLQEAYVQGYWQELAAFTRAMFNNTFKTNPSLYRGIMTGITRVSKESIFSDLNNLDAVTTTSDKYATCFGFTEPEVFQALEDQGFGEQDREDVKAWYDGFTFGCVTDIYNPWSVTNYLDKKKPGTYWANTSSNGLVSTLMRQGDSTIKTQFETLLAGGTITGAIDEQIIFDQLDRDPDAVWSFLLASGYLKVTKLEIREDERRRRTVWYTLSLTNLEVEMMFDDMVRGWFKEGGAFGPFVTAMFRGDEEGMNWYMNRISMNVFSHFDTGKGPGESEPEKFYHGFVLGLMADQVGNYDLRSNRESGLGRYDVMMIPKKPGNPAVIIEFKVLNSRKGERSLEDTAANALKQIEEKKYETELIAQGIPADSILKYGFAFRGKACLIRMA